MNLAPNISKYTEKKHHQFYMYKYTKSLFYTLVASLKEWAKIKNDIPIRKKEWPQKMQINQPKASK